MGMNSIDAEDDQFAYRYDTQLLIDRRDKDLDEDEIADYITDHIEGNSLIAAGDEDLVKIHFHTNEPWKVLEYCSTVGEIYDIVVEDMIRQSAGSPSLVMPKSLSDLPLYSLLLINKLNAIKSSAEEMPIFDCSSRILILHVYS